MESGQLGPIVSQLSVNSEAVSAATQGNMADFVKALEKDSGDVDKDKKAKPESPPEKKDDKKKEDDEGMQLDWIKPARTITKIVIE